jgi:four helix bundle protein
VHSQLDRARTSVPLNIAEGHGKSSPPDRCRFLETARGSAVECACCLDLMLIKRAINEEEMNAGKVSLQKVVSMLIGLIQDFQPDGFREDTVECGVTLPPSVCIDAKAGEQE